MTLRAGDRLGPHEILAPLGAGGMGEVYRARDPRLGREVAIKVLRADAMQSPERRRRFEVEARAVSALNHPNILTIHDIGETGGTPFIVSELLEGQSLRTLLNGAAPGLRDTLDIAVQVADGLAAAHAAGITHRDLKPENLFVLPDGRVKILDFGLAKMETMPAGEDETRTVSDLLTSPGMIVGTIAYMSPEQVNGLPVDFRSDHFSLGTILYEMVGGKRPFDRGDRLSLMTAIVREEPEPLAAMNPQVPAPFRWIIERCLAKQPARRFAATADLHQQLRDLRDHFSELSTGAPALPPPARRRSLVAPLLALAGVAAGFLLAWAIARPRVQNSSYRYTPFATEAIDEQQPVWSPDGQTLAYIGATGGIGQVFARGINSTIPAQLTHAAATCSDPFWAPDGTRIYYRSQASLWSVGAAGGAPQLVLPNIAMRNFSASISPDGKTMAFFRPAGPGQALHLAPVAGGNPEVFKRPPFPADFRFCDWLGFSPDGRKLGAALRRAIGVDAILELWIIPYPEGTPRRVPWKLGQGVRLGSVSWTRDNRRCVFSLEENTPGNGSHLSLVDTDTGEIEPITAGTGQESQPSVSPDGSRIAFASGGTVFDLAEISLDGSKTTPLLATSRQEYAASWSPSGRQYAYVSNTGGSLGIWLRSVPENWVRPVVEGLAEVRVDQPRISRDGQRLTYMRMQDRHDVWISNLSGGRAVPLEQESSDQHAPAWSPDGDWIVYTRFMGQKWEIAKAPSGGGGRAIRLCDGGDSTAWLEWSPSGKWIAFKSPEGVYLAGAGGGSPTRVHAPAAAFAFSRDGALLYVIRRAEDSHWELASLSVPDGAGKKSVRLSLPPETSIREMSLHPDGNRFVVSVGTNNRDIWILDGFAPDSGAHR